MPDIKIPQNMVGIFAAASERTGVPIGILAAVVLTQTGSIKSTLQREQVEQIGDVLAAQAETSDPSDPNWHPSDWAAMANAAFGGSSTKWIQRFNSYYDPYAKSDDATWTYGENDDPPAGTYRTPVIGGGVSGGGRVLVTTGGTGTNVRSDPDPIDEARRWADSIAMSLTGRVLSNTEMQTVVQNGWNPGQLDSYLRQQKFGNSNATIGEAVDLREAMKRSFQKVMGRDPTEGEINWAIVNKIPTNHTDALAEQTKTGTVWGGDPESYMTARSALRQIMNQFGIVVDDEHIDAALVNQALTGKWTLDQMRAAVAAGQMPGQPNGTTVDHFTTTKQLADSIWKTYFPTTTMPQPYVTQFLAMTPDQISAFVRGLPSPEAKANGQVIPVGVYNDARTAAQRALAALGVVGREPTAQEIGAFASGKFDVESITKHYSTDPGVLAVNPGAQYGTSREDYFKTRSATEAAFNDRFGGVDRATLAADKARADNPTPGAAAAEPDWLKAVFKEGMSAEQSASLFDDYFRRLGKAPDASDITAFKTRSKTVYSDYVQGRQRPEPGGAMAGTQPTAPGLGASKDKRGFV